jgi:hypothetical protein
MPRRRTSSPAQRAGRPQPRAEAEGRRPGKRAPHPGGLKGRENFVRFDVSRTVRGAEQRCRPPQKSRGPPGRTALSISPPRASACGLRCPGLRSPGPLGRPESMGRGDAVLAGSNKIAEWQRSLNPLLLGRSLAPLLAGAVDTERVSLEILEHLSGQLRRV